MSEVRTKSLAFKDLKCGDDLVGDVTLEELLERCDKVKIMMEERTVKFAGLLSDNYAYGVACGLHAALAVLCGGNVKFGGHGKI